MKLHIHFEEVRSEFCMKLDAAYKPQGGGGDVPIYDGEYEATPIMETQIFQTIGLRMAQNFVVDPIPRNYGLITWNGFELTVS